MIGGGRRRVREREKIIVDFVSSLLATTTQVSYNDYICGVSVYFREIIFSVCLYYSFLTFDKFNIYC